MIYHDYKFKVWNIFSFQSNSNIKNFSTSYGDCLLKHQTLSSQCGILGWWSRSHKIRFLSFQSFLFIVVIVMSILLKTTFSQISIHSQLLVKIL